MIGIYHLPGKRNKTRKKAARMWLQSPIANRQFASSPVRQFAVHHSAQFKYVLITLLFLWFSLSRYWLQDNFNVLHIAAMYSREDVVKLLLNKRGVDPFSTGGVSIVCCWLNYFFVHSCFFLLLLDESFFKRYFNDTESHTVADGNGIWSISRGFHS